MIGVEEENVPACLHLRQRLSVEPDVIAQPGACVGFSNQLAVQAIVIEGGTTVGNLLHALTEPVVDIGRHNEPLLQHLIQAICRVVGECPQTMAGSVASFIMADRRPCSTEQAVGGIEVVMLIRRPVEGFAQAVAVLVVCVRGGRQVADSETIQTVKLVVFELIGACWRLAKRQVAVPVVLVVPDLAREIDLLEPARQVIAARFTRPLPKNCAVGSPSAR